MHWRNYMMKKSICLIILLLLLVCCSNRNGPKDDNALSQLAPSDSSLHESEPVSFKNLSDLKPTDIKCQEISDFYSIYAVAVSNDKILIQAGRNNGDFSFLILYDVHTSKDTYISDLTEAILHVDIIDKNTFCVSTYTELYVIKDDKVLDQIKLPPDKTFDYRYDCATNLLCYIDNSSNLVIENLESGESKIICNSISHPVENKNSSSSDAEANRVIERGANPIFFDNSNKVAFVKLGKQDVSLLFVYNIENQLIEEYPMDIFLYSYKAQQLNSSLIITNYQDVPQDISILKRNTISTYNLGINYNRAFISKYGLLVQGTDDILYWVDMNDYIPHKLSNINAEKVISDATSTENYIVALLIGENNSSSITIMKKGTCPD